MFNLLSARTAYSPPTIVATRDTFEAALAAAHELLPVYHYELDADYPGCADLITQYGSVYMIEPAPLNHIDATSKPANVNTSTKERHNDISRPSLMERMECLALA
jgi:hypothetical protein